MILNPHRFGSPLASTFSLLHCDGADLSTTITQSVAAGPAFSVSGSPGPYIATAAPKFGTASLYSNGTTGYYVDGGADARWSFDGTTGTVTHEFWVNTESNGSNRVMFGLSGTPRWAIQHQTGTDIIRVWNSTSGYILVGTTAIRNSVWHAIAFVKNGTSCKLFIDGVEEASATNSVGTAATPTLHLFDNTLNGESFGGYIDEYRASSAALYTGNYTPATSAFPGA